MSLTRTGSGETIAAGVAEVPDRRQVFPSGLYYRPAGSGGARAGSLMSSGDVATGSSAVIGLRTVTPPTEAVPRNVQNRIALAFRTCREAIDRAADSGDDEITYANSMAELNEALGRLWDQRRYRERNYAGIVNMLQLLIAAEGPRLSSDQLAGMKACLSLITRYAKVSRSDYRAALERLQRAGLDIASALR